MGGPGAASASADALNLAEAAGANASGFITADQQVLNLGRVYILPESGGTQIHIIGF
jgi:hypothetical protein